MNNKYIVILTNVLAALAPYFTFMEYHDYPYLATEAMLYFLFFLSLGLAAGLLAAYISPRRAVIVTSLVMFFSYDLQFNNSLSSNIAIVFYVIIIVFLLRKLQENGYKICVAALGAFIFSILTIGVEDLSSDISFAENTARAEKTTDKPIIVNIVIDEHIGIEGVPSNVPGGEKFARDIRAQYEEQGYTLFGNAFSEYSYTRFSLASAFNNVETVKNELQMDTGGEQWMSQNFNLSDNNYLKEMSKRGYRVFIRQSSYLNLCGAKDVTYARCQTYDFSKLEDVAKTDLSIESKLLLFVSFHIQNTRVRKSLIVVTGVLEKSWNFVTGNDAKTNGLSWVSNLVSWERPRIGALSHANAIDLLGDDVVKASPGDLFLTHFLQPHFPYVYDADCKIRPVSQWIHRGTNPGYDRKDQDLRERIYKGYFANARCVDLKIKKFTEKLKKAGMLEKVVIVIQGDHGSRILINELYSNEFNDPEAHKEAYSTLFAVRIPGQNKEPYRKEPASIRALLWELIENGFTAVPAEKDRGKPTVMAPDPKQKKYIRIEYLGVNSSGK